MSQSDVAALAAATTDLELLVGRKKAQTKISGTTINSPLHLQSNPVQKNLKRHRFSFRGNEQRARVMLARGGKKCFRSRTD